MKLKFYLRGLGIGVVVTALIMGIATKDKLPLTDAEIKAAAAKLGMVESDSLKLSDLDQDGEDAGQPPEGTGTPKPESDSEAGDGTALPDQGGEDAGQPPEETGTPKPESESDSEAGDGTAPPDQDGEDAGQPPEGTGAPKPESEPDTEGGTAPSEPAARIPDMTSGITETVTITIRRGTGSRAVCSMLAEAGLIEDAAAFDQYLIDSGYSKRISAGTFEIPAGASEEDMAKIISRSK
mgnify:CR=1 FL=1